MNDLDEIKQLMKLLIMRTSIMLEEMDRPIEVSIQRDKSGKIISASSRRSNSEQSEQRAS